MKTFKSSNRTKQIFSLKMLLLLLGFALLSTQAKADKIRMTIKEELASCTGVAPQNCYQVKYKKSKDWEFFYDQIEGFEYTPGYRYVIDVKRTKRKNIPADASAYTYKLKKIIKKEKITNEAATELAFIVKHKWNLIQMNGATPPASSAYLVFQADGKRIGGSAGCNRISGGFELTKDKISFSKIASTLMACPDENKNKLEGTLLKMLTDTTFRYDIADQTLNLYQGDKLVLMFGMSPLE
ncbi:MAG: DUF4377 domain-containing protein [Flavobacterium sp.]|nr:DUF4377 domain-containing protein [Flavobacterium sp.]PZO23915.1 MAG: hypothetical protein DCE86_17195 [Flavobacteriaceae bacterium]